MALFKQLTQCHQATTPITSLPMKKCILATLAFAFLAASVSAITINIDDRFIGIYGKEFGTNSTKATGNEHLSELQTMLGLYNTASTQTGYSIGSLASGAAVPAPNLPIPNTHFLQNSNGPGTSSLTAILPNIGSLYLGLKSANEVAFYYLGGLLAGTEFTVNNANDGKEISNWSYYGTPVPPSTNVPDASSTLALLGLGLATLGILRRRAK